MKVTKFAMLVAVVVALLGAGGSSQAVPFNCDDHFEDPVASECRWAFETAFNAPGFAIGAIDFGGNTAQGNTAPCKKGDTEYAHGTTLLDNETGHYILCNNGNWMTL